MCFLFIINKKQLKLYKHEQKKEQLLDIIIGLSDKSHSFKYMFRLHTWRGTSSVQGKQQEKNDKRDREANGY